MTVMPDSLAGLAAENTAVPIWLVDSAGYVSWANLPAQEGMERSLKSMRKKPLEHFGVWGQGLGKAAVQARDEARSVVVREWSSGRGPLQDIHARYLADIDQVCLSLVPSAGGGSTTPEASALGFGRMLAHELKNPIASIRGAAQLIARSPDPEGAVEMASMIIEDADRMARLADRWSRVGDIRLGQTGPVNLNRLAHTAHERVGRVNADKALMISDDFDPSLPDGEGDEDLLLQVIINFLQNAMDALDGQTDGHVQIETRYDSASISRSGATPAPLIVNVIDNGPGIPDQLRASVFTPFVTTKPAGEGLGLAFAARIAALHGGSIDCVSDPGRTVFSLRLPVCLEVLP